MLVQLITHTNDPEKTIAAAAKLCYSDAHIETLLDGLTPEKTEAFLQRLNDVGHASPIEHAAGDRGHPRGKGTVYRLDERRR